MLTSFYAPVQDYLLFLKHTVFSGFSVFVHTPFAQTKSYLTTNVHVKRHPYQLIFLIFPLNRCGFSRPSSRCTFALITP